MAAGSGALAGLRVVEYAQQVSGPYCGKLLADLGADVVKVEPPAGDATRRSGPFPPGAPHPEQSGLFHYLNTGKRGVTLDLDRAGDRVRCQDLLHGADLLIHDCQPAAARARGLAWAQLRRRHPRLVAVAVTPFGQTGPYCDHRAYPLNVFQASGEGYLTPARLDRPDRPPVNLGGHAGEYIAGVAAATAALAGLFARDTYGRGVLVDVAQQEALLFVNLQDLPRYLTTGVLAARGRRGYRIAGIVPCADGHVLFYYHRPEEWRAMLAAVGHPAWGEDASLADRALAEARGPEVSAALAATFRQFTRAELLERAMAHQVAIAPCRNAAEVLQSPHLRARGFFADYAHPQLGRVQLPGRLFSLSATPFALHRPAPALGEHNAALDGDPWTAAPHPTPGAAADAVTRRRRSPLTHIRVLDFAWGWAGPLVSWVLGSLGADVIKVESARRMDFMRQAVDPLSGACAGPNTSLLFNVVNVNRRSITLDLQHPAGQTVLADLIRQCDVLVESFRPGVAAKLGLDYARVQSLRPDIIHFSFSACGQSGPESSLPGYGPLFCALGGLSEITGYPDGPPVEIRAEGDVLGGLAGAFGVLAALRHRAATGQGQSIDCAGQEVVACTLGDVLLEHQLTGAVAGRQGNSSPDCVPCHCYPAAGDDRWISIAVGSDAEWQALRQALGDPDWAAAERFATAAGRRQRQDELDACLAQCTRQHSAQALSARLQAAGVAALPAFPLDELTNDPHVVARGACAYLNHPEAGRYGLPRLPWLFTRIATPPTRPAPRLGEHTVEVLEGLLGHSAAAVAALRAAGALT